MDEQILIHEEQLLKQTNSYRYAGFWMRFWAYLLDLLIGTSINGILVAPLLTTFDLRDSVELILMTIVTFLYFIVFTKKWGQTLGKMVFGLKVISKSSAPLTWSDLIFREVVGRYILQAFTLSYTLYITIAFQRKKQGLHDMIGDTYVVYEDYSQ